MTSDFLAFPGRWEMSDYSYHRVWKVPHLCASSEARKVVMIMTCSSLKLTKPEKPKSKCLCATGRSDPDAKKVSFLEGDGVRGISLAPHFFSTHFHFTSS